MNRTSCNVLFVYSLLVIDLIVNIIDNLLSVPVNQSNSQAFDQQRRLISNVVFIIVMVQIVAIICIIFDLIVHFFNISDLIKDNAWGEESKISSAISRRAPMPQRLALKLVLDKYWWSLLVGLFYLILTIILQIVRLDPTWHLRVQTGKSEFNEIKSKLVKMNMDELDIPINKEIIIKTADSIGKEPETTSLSLSELNLLPIMLILIHKLVSTCYYVSFLVVYRASPNQMVNRIFSSPAIMTNRN